MKKIYFLILSLFFLGFLCSNSVSAQLTATSTGYESRCAATGAIKIVATGGSGNYQYKAEGTTAGTVTTNFTDLDSITGLSSGIYNVIVNDLNTNQTFTQTGVAVFGSYKDPSYSLNHTDVTCDNGSNGSISIQGFILNGRSPFVFSIVAPSPMGVGTSNSTGTFAGLMAGDYTVRMTDSCGGIQTRTVTINNYTWWLDSYSFTKTSCDQASGYIAVSDSKGNNSKTTTIPGFSYGVVRSAGDTIWTADGNFANVTVTGIRSIDVLAKDGCGNIKKATLSLFLIPAVDANVSISNKTCKDFTASVTGITNFFNPQFCLFDVNNVQVGGCNSTGVFNNVSYGSYSIKAHDACTDTTIIRSFTVVAPVVSIGNNVVISNKVCNTFSVTVTGQQNLTNPNYCLINSGGINIACNTTGNFDNVPTDGSYCIVTKDGCIDTTITRCFSVSRPIPKISPVIIPSYVTCTNFGLNVGGDSLTNPIYCLYDNNGVLVGACNNTGIFDSIPLGNYCVTIYDACRDTTIKRCFNVGPPIIINDVNIKITNQACTTFTATASSSNLKNAGFCLFNSTDSSLISCNTTGVFNLLAYGNYYIKSTNACPDTTMINSFSATRAIPSVNSNVKITNNTCSTFSMQITGQKNLINPTYCLIDTTTHITLGCNTTGIANNIPYGSYLVQIVSGCNDTLRIPFTSLPVPLVITANAQNSCYYGTSKFNVNIVGVLPVNIRIFNPDGTLIRDRNFNATNFSMDSIPGLSSGLYTIVATDGCGNRDTVTLAPVVGFLIHSPSVTAKCPGSVWPNGSGDINTTISTNLPSVSVKIVVKNGAPVSISPSFVSGSNYTFNDLGPGTYVIQYRASDGCNVNIYDTLTISPYKFPDLQRSSAYQCDNNGFSIGAVVSNGVGPFTYEIFGSVPSGLLVPPQSDPVFNINDGTTYSLLRLRALDACGNATLGDFSILPLVNNGITSTSNCILEPTTLSVDTIYNSTYTWYLKANSASTDSVLVGNGFNYYIPQLVYTDTGVYVCHIVVNSGCIERTYYFHLDGSCYKALPISLEDFSGKFVSQNVLLNWRINNTNDLNQIIVERKTNNNFAEIVIVSPHLPSANNQYQFIDSSPGSQNFYRLKIVKNDNTFTYSNIIFLQKQIVSGITIYPNPATDVLNIGFYQPNRHTYRVSLLNMLNQKLKEVIFNTGTGSKLQIRRTREITSGIYILQFIDMNTNEEFSQKVIFGAR